MIRMLIGPVVALMGAGAHADADARATLADMLVNRAVGFVANNYTLPSEYELALLVAVEGASIARDEVDLWRTVVQLADLADAPDVAERALGEITRLDPRDEVATLRRLSAALDRLPTVDQRRNAVSRMIRESRLAPPIASRLAFDLALLLQRAGDADGYLEWLAEAVALDPSNGLAVSDLAGYLAGTTADPTFQAELLMARCLANPTYTPAIDVFAHFLTHQGADATALRLRQLLLSLRGGAARARVDDLMMAAMAAWSAGDDRLALSLIQRRQDHEDQLLRAALGAMRDAITAGRPTDELAEAILQQLSPASGAMMTTIVERAAPDPPPNDSILRAVAPIPLPPASAAVAILHPIFHDDGAVTDEFNRVADAMIASVRSDLRSRGADGLSSDEVATLVVVSIWLLHGTPFEEVAFRDIVTPAIQMARDELPPLARGWLALRAGEFDEAIRLLKPEAEQSAFAALGLATIQMERGRNRSAAEALLGVARSTPAGLAGVWARKRLEVLLGTPVTLTSNASAVEAVASTLPAIFDRLLTQPGRHLSIAVRTPQQDFELLERVAVDVEISNRSDLPLAISPAGPIFTSVAVPLSITEFGRQGAARDLPMPIFVDIGQRLRLEPWETLTVRANLSRGVVTSRITLGLALADLTTTGAHAILRGRAILNPVPAPFGGTRGLVEPALLGSESGPIALRALGTTQDLAWFDRTVALLSDEATAPDPMLAAMLAAWASRFDVDRAMQLSSDPATLERNFSDRVRALELAYPRLDPDWRAVVTLMLAGNRRRLESINWLARTSNDRSVRLAALLATATTPTDPYIDEIRRDGDPTLRRIAELMSDILTRRSADQ